MSEENKMNIWIGIAFICIFYVVSCIAFDKYKQKTDKLIILVKQEKKNSEKIRVIKNEIALANKRIEEIDEFRYQIGELERKIALLSQQKNVSSEFFDMRFESLFSQFEVFRTQLAQIEKRLPKEIWEK
jgi:hypothetical protein